MFRYSFSSISTDRSTIYDYDDDHKRLSKSVAFETGDILVTCRPFIHIIADSWRGKICDLCLRQPIGSKNLYICRDCQQIHFCRSCQQLQSPSIFKNVHNLECPLLAKYGHILSSSSRLFLRLYLRLTNPESIHYQPIFNPLTREPINFEQLELAIIIEHNELADRITICCEKFANKSDDNDEQSTDMTTEEFALLQFIGLLDELRLCRDDDDDDDDVGENEILSMISDDDKIYELWKIFVRLWSYTLPIFDETLTGLFLKDAIAYGLYLEPSILTADGVHSCIPNCSFIHYGPVIQLRAMKSIEIGEQLFINYVDISLSRMERLKQLRNYYIGDCICTRCMEEQNDGNDMIDIDLFHSLREEFITQFQEEFIDSTLKNQSFLNFSTTSNNHDENEMIMKEKCLKMSQLARQLDEQYQQLYLFEHPEKSRFLFAFMAVEMNLLLFKLEFREQLQQQQKQHANMLINTMNGHESNGGRSQKNSRESGSITTLDTIIIEIKYWSDLLKRTVRSIRITHGIDHRLYREYPVPILNIWHKTLPKSLTLERLYQDPGILMSCSLSHDSSFSKEFLSEQFEFIKGQFAKLFNDKQQQQQQTNIIRQEKSKSINKKRYDHYKVLFRILLVIFALLFPFFIYFTMYLENSDF
ncbi:uncharacterized protein LOC124493075 [Dermatophagoides farinae]|uniref:uncharacterized protein LOC124493075 n=1 Tax=Dermatophagoides farinae TaxID=6954 RepID=UPI003F60D149